jgi:hypothetical protein
MVTPKNAPSETDIQIDTEELARREKYFELVLIALLLCFGIYQSILYFGHTIVPNPDFPDFFKTGQELLSFQIPSRFQRGPVLGLLQAFVSCLVGGQHPGLTAGWLLNAILHPLNLLLLYLVGREIVGKSALWLAIITILNPQVIYLLTEPIAETTLLFFILLTFYCIFNRSKWRYVLASITMMIRYEGAALIMAAFIIDMIYLKSKREKFRALLYSALASVPLALWMLGMLVNWQSENYLTLFGKEYSKLYVEPPEARTGFVKHLNVLWKTGFYPLLMPTPEASREIAALVWNLSKTFAAVGFFFGTTYGLCKRQWKILALVIFLIPYFGIHAKFPSPLLRYHIPIFWIALMICMFGLQSIWKLIDRNSRVPRALVFMLQAIVTIISAIWLISLIRYLPKMSSISPRSVFLPYVAMALVAIIFAARLYIYKYRYFLRELSIWALMCLFIVSNQFVLVNTVGDGQKEKEFKLLADWFVTNAKQGEKMGVYMAGVVKIFAPKVAEYIVRLPQAESPEEFIKTCRDQNITYVVWATREGLSYDHTGYRQFHLHENIKDLANPKSQGAYQFVSQVGSERGYVNIFRLR